MEPDRTPIRSRGLVLILIACAVGFGTDRLVSSRDALTPAARLSEQADLAVLAEADWEVTVRPEHPLLPAQFHSIEDELLASPMLHHADFQVEVERWVGRWSDAFSEWMPSYLDRMTGFEQMVDTTLAAHELPWSLRYLPVIESGYSPSAVSSAEAVGLWQFMAPTARGFGIEVGPIVDDRRDPFVSTAAAADYLMQLRGDFGSWFLALAAYNAGPDRIRGLLERYVPDVEPSDAVYWALRDVLPRETADFVPNLIGAIIVASDPEAHGYDRPTPRPFEFDRVPVVGTISFETAALAAGADVDEIERLNPEYIRGETPAESQVDLRLPPGHGPAFRAFFVQLQEAPGGS
jgi:membrane-bound lytic murein transglycosylase D